MYLSKYLKVLARSSCLSTASKTWLYRSSLLLASKSMALTLGKSTPRCMPRLAGVALLFISTGTPVGFGGLLCPVAVLGGAALAVTGASAMSIFIFPCMLVSLEFMGVFPSSTTTTVYPPREFCKPPFISLAFCGVGRARSHNVDPASQRSKLRSRFASATCPISPEFNKRVARCVANFAGQYIAIMLVIKGKGPNVHMTSSSSWYF